MTEHLSDEELQALAEDPGAPSTAPHLADCDSCRAEVAAYLRIGEGLDRLERPHAPLGFTASVLTRLPPEPAALGPADLAAVVLATGAALAAAVLLQQAGGAPLLLELLHRLPGTALAEAMVAASLHGHQQISVLLFLSVAALLVGAPLWRVLSPRRSFV